MEFDNNIAAGRVIKSASIDVQEVTEEELKLINKFTLSPLEESEVFSFKMVLCDNEVDRDFEAFSLRALEQLKKLFIGKTIIKDHMPRADNQVARIYSTELKKNGNTTQLGEPYTQLIAKCYMVKTAENESLIAEIKGGIKKEASVGCRTISAICSICGTDNAKKYCNHYAGRSYEKDGKEQVCTYRLDNATDAYEVSLVAIPAQRNAGACKNYGEKPCCEDNDRSEKNENISSNKESELNLRFKAIDSFIFTNKFKEE